MNPRRGIAPGRYAYIAPQLNQAKDIAWNYLKQFSEPLWGKPPNESELYVELKNESRIRIYGADNADRIRGGYLDHALLDEYGDMRPSVWGEIVRPMLSDYGGGATFIGTPKGRNQFYDIIQRAKRDPDNWFHFNLPASETGILPADELAAARLDMTPEQFAQEYECSFDAAILGAYYGKEVAEAERQGRVTDVPVSDGVPVHTVWDLGIGDSTAIWFFQVIGNEVCIIDHYENNGFGLPHYASVLAERGYAYGFDYVPHDAKVKELGTGRTRVETLKSLGRNPKLVPNHKIMDGINAGRLLFQRCWFDSYNCADGLEALRQYRADYDEKTRAFKNEPKHDWTSHTADAFRYLAMAYKEIAPSEFVPRGRLLMVGEGNEVTMDDLWKNQPRRKSRI